MSELFVEIGTEEIPAGYIQPAFQFLENFLTDHFRKNRIAFTSSRSLGTPRRLVLSVTGLAARQEDVVETHYGPSVKAAFDDQGNPTKAALGFARGKGVEVSALSREVTEKGEVICAKVEKIGQPTRDILNELLPRVIAGIPFPKKMRWGAKSLPFARPIQWIVGLFDGSILDFEFDGIRCQNQSRGHRFLDPRPFAVENLETYLKEAATHSLIVDPEIRRQTILEQVHQLAGKSGGRVEDDPDLLDEVACLVEHPNALLCDFDQKYLELPKELLVMTMKHHQRYFPVSREDGSLMAHFITVSNMRTDDPSHIKRGNERVLRARLEDARFFFDEDRKKKLEAFVEPLKGVVFQRDLGTVFEKVERIRSLAEKISGSICPEHSAKAGRAASLCKADLVTQMVFEFPELQGITGGYYARHSGEDPEVARAIQEHYRPAFAGDEPPSTPIGSALAIADKLDTILGCISVNLLPSGSEDPYALRRHALGIIQIVLRGGWDVSLEEWIGHGLRSLEGKAKLSPEQVKTHVLDLFALRFKSHLQSEGFPYDVIDAVLSAGIDSLVDVQSKVRALSDLKAQPHFEPLATTFRRVVSILNEDASGPVQPELLREPQEKSLYEHGQTLSQPVEQLINQKDFSGALARIVEIKPSVDQFFDHVLVMAKEEDVKRNRLRLLGGISRLFSRIADFDKIVVKKS